MACASKPPRAKQQLRLQLQHALMRQTDNKTWVVSLKLQRAIAGSNASCLLCMLSGITADLAQHTSLSVRRCLQQQQKLGSVWCGLSCTAATTPCQGVGRACQVDCMLCLPRCDMAMLTRLTGLVPD